MRWSASLIRPIGRHLLAIERSLCQVLSSCVCQYPSKGFSIRSEPYVDQVNCPDAPIKGGDMVVNDTSADAQIHNVTSEVARCNLAGSPLIPMQMRGVKWLTTR